MKTPRNSYMQAGEQLLRESGCVAVWRRSNSGRARLDADWTIDVPEPRGPISFGIFAHEVAHQLLHRSSRKPRWLEEVEAEEWALAQFDRFDLLGKDRYEVNVEKHLARSFAKALRRGASYEKIEATLAERFKPLLPNRDGETPTYVVFDESPAIPENVTLSTARARLD